MGLNEFAGYVAVAAAALATGWIAARYRARPEPFYLGVGFVVVGLALSVSLVRETRRHVAIESSEAARRGAPLTPRRCSGGRRLGDREPVEPSARPAW